MPTGSNRRLVKILLEPGEVRFDCLRLAAEIGYGIGDRVVILQP